VRGNTLSEQFVSQRALLPVALGKDTAGTPVVIDLTKALHVPIAGCRGSGRTPCINTIVASIAYRGSPARQKMRRRGSVREIVKGGAIKLIQCAFNPVEVFGRGTTRVDYERFRQRIEFDEARCIVGNAQSVEDIRETGYIEIVAALPAS
jgi:hypothetical protein